MNEGMRKKRWGESDERCPGMDFFVDETKYLLSSFPTDTKVPLQCTSHTFVHWLTDQGAKGRASFFIPSSSLITSILSLCKLLLVKRSIEYKGTRAFFVLFIVLSGDRRNTRFTGWVIALEVLNDVHVVVVVPLPVLPVSPAAPS